MNHLISSRRFWAFVMVVGALLAAAFMVLSAPPQAHAQCGSSASSCKACHEVQGQDPVSDKGDWHVAHAFGDFCEFCHAGNVQATDKDAAHQGLVDPLEDVKASCQSCHPQDYMDKAQVYASALGVELSTGGGGGGSGAAPSGGAGGESGAASGESSSGESATSGGETTIAVPSGGEIVDYNELLEEKRHPQEGLSSGDKVLIGLIAILAVVFIVTAWKLERVNERLSQWWQENMQIASAEMQLAAAGVGAVPMPSLGELGGTRKAPAPSAPAVPPVEIPEALEEVFRRNPALRDVWPQLVQTDPETLRAMANLLPTPAGREAIQELSHIDLNLIDALEKLPLKDQLLLIALAVQE